MLQLHPVEQLSDTASNSPSLRASSTDAERELGVPSSPSTGFTSFTEGEEEKENEAGQQAFSSNINTPLARVRASSSVSARGNGSGTAKWRMPFARGSALLKASPSSSSSAAVAPDAKGFTGEGYPEGDAGFVETTSAQAALALAQYWNDANRIQDANGKGKGRANDRNTDYAVIARVQNGKKVYKIRYGPPH